ncbi:MAG: hypothetical protein IMZ53_01455 [Thermoplasmata archaeon]|nr:hypothetical protein [Thermoplasmata archaeon]MBE3139229.1 hypothetical protein [Thermoplasmata archaeon]
MQSYSTCPVCKGSKVTTKIDLIQAKTTRMPCGKCQGTGEVKDVQTDGIRCGRKIGETFFWQQLKDGHVVATLEVRACPVFLDGVPQFKINGTALFKKQKRMPRLYIEIVRMNTIPGFQRQGLMRQLVGSAIGDSKIEWAETNLNDSSPEGIALMKDMGFHEEGNKLIKEMGLEPA